MLTEAVQDLRDAMIGRERKQEAETRGQADKSPEESTKYRKRGQRLIEQKSEGRLIAARRTGRSRHSEKDVRRKRREEETARYMTHSKTGVKGKDGKTRQEL